MCRYLKRNLLPWAGKSLHSTNTQYAFPVPHSSFQIKLNIEPIVPLSESFADMSDSDKEVPTKSKDEPGNLSYFFRWNLVLGKERNFIFNYKTQRKIKANSRNNVPREETSKKHRSMGLIFSLVTYQKNRNCDLGDQDLQLFQM